MAKSHVDGLLHTVPLFSHCTKKELTQLSGLTPPWSCPPARSWSARARLAKSSPPCSWTFLTSPAAFSRAWLPGCVPLTQALPSNAKVGALRHQGGTHVW